MRLTCPRCGAQYEIAESAIPVAGREVECSACAHVWHQPGAGKAAAPYDPAARPMLNRPLNESILSILREETARELQARTGTPPAKADSGSDAETGDEDTDQNIANRDARARPASALPASAPGDHDWPATTLTEAVRPGATDRPPVPAGQELSAPISERTEQEPPEDAPAEEETPAPTLPDAAELAATLTRSGPSPATTETATEAAIEAPAPTEASAAPVPGMDTGPVPAGPFTAPATPARHGSGYATGFGLAAMLALGIVTVYALAPRVPAGVMGGVLGEWRQEIDRGRLWLHDRIFDPATED